MPDAVRTTLWAGRTWRLSVVNLGLACCAVEFTAAALSLSSPPADAGGPRVSDVLDLPGVPGVIDVLVVSGTVTVGMGANIRAAYDALPAVSRRVLAFGACATTGGPYWDSYCVVAGVDALIPVDVYVPGCPPRPAALLEGLQKLDALIGAA